MGPGECGGSLRKGGKSERWDETQRTVISKGVKGTDLAIELGIRFGCSVGIGSSICRGTGIGLGSGISGRSGIGFGCSVWFCHFIGLASSISACSSI